ncbi:MAG: hypothetical protein R2769_05640 [Saprospiraceae bacterium]
MKNVILLGLFLIPFGVSAQLEMDNFDNSVKANDDFYHHVNGTWIKNTEIPATEGRWASFLKSWSATAPF